MEEERREPVRWVTVEEVAAHCEVTRQTVRRWLRSGELRGVRVGRQWRVDAASVEGLARHRWLWTRGC